MPDTAPWILAKDPAQNERLATVTDALTPDVDEVLCYDNSKEFIRVFMCRFDVVIDTEQWHYLSAVIARLIRAPMKIGFGTNKRQRMFNHVIEYDQAIYEPTNFAALLKPLRINGTQTRSEKLLTLPNNSVLNVDQMLKPLQAQPFVVIFPGSSIPQKRWDAERFSTVAKQLAVDGYKVIVVGRRGEQPEGDVIAEPEGLNLAGMTTLSETAAIISRSSLLISGDSGVLHLAVGLDIPTVSLFGPSSVAKWSPKGDKHIVLSRNLDCSPCSKFGTTPPCPNNIRCMKEITADQVLEAAVILLNKYSKKT